MPKCSKCNKELSYEEVGSDYYYDDWTGTYYYDDDILCDHCKEVTQGV